MFILYKLMSFSSTKSYIKNDNNNDANNKDGDYKSFKKKIVDIYKKKYKDASSLIHEFIENQNLDKKKKETIARYLFYSCLKKKERLYTKFFTNSNSIIKKGELDINNILEILKILDKNKNSNKNSNKNLIINSIINYILDCIYKYFSGEQYSYEKTFKYTKLFHDRPRMRFISNNLIKYNLKHDYDIIKQFDTYISQYMSNELYKYNIYIKDKLSSKYSVKNLNKNILNIGYKLEKSKILGINNILKLRKDLDPKITTKVLNKKINKAIGNNKVFEIFSKINKINIDNDNKAIIVIKYLMDKSMMLNEEYFIFNNKLKKYYDENKKNNSILNTTDLYLLDLFKFIFYYDKIDIVNQKFINYINFVKIFMFIKLIIVFFNKLKNNNKNINNNIIDDKPLLLHTNINITELMNIKNDCRISLCIFDEFTVFKKTLISSILFMINSKKDNLILIFLYLHIFNLKKIFIDNMKKYKEKFTEKELDEKINEEIININTSKSICELLQEHQQNP